MSKYETREEQLEHDLANVEQEKLALQGLLKKAATEIDSLIEADCDEQASGDAEKMAEKMRRAASL